MKKAQIKLVTIILIFILIIGFIFFLKRPKNYTREYNIDDIQVEENYDKLNKLYHFKLSNDNVYYEYVIENKFINKKELIDNINSYENEKGEKCLLPNSKKLSFYPVCNNGQSFIDYSLLEEPSDDFFQRAESPLSTEKYKNIEILNKTFNNYLIWANRGYYFIGDKENKELMFLEKESYYNNLSYQLGEYVITPNYDEEFTFKTIYIINMKNGKVKKWETKFNINYNSYYLGDKDGVIYLFDRKERREYAIDPRKRNIEVVDKNGIGKIWNDSFEQVSTVKLASNDYQFKNTNIIDFENNDGLKAHFKDGSEILLSKRNDIQIIASYNTRVFYISKDLAYEYSFTRGEEELLKYNEWNFNNKNSLFIYKH